MQRAQDHKVIEIPRHVKKAPTSGMAADGSTNSVELEKTTEKKTVTVPRHR
jgi:replication-associated recombination protein RarA